MLQRLCCVLMIGLVVGLWGCRPGAVKHVKQAAQYLRNGSSKVKTAPAVTQGVARQLSQNEEVLAQVAARGANLLSRSKTLGERLVSLQSKIPAQAYPILYRRWQDNQAELSSYTRQLQDPALDPQRRDRLEQSLRESEFEQAEIERLVDQYG